MIISGSLGQHIVPRVHDMSQVDFIFIFCGNRKWHEQWAKQWTKIKGVFTEITPICEALKQAAQQCEQNAIPISFVATSGDISKKNLDPLEPSFMYTPILKEILLSIKFQEKHIKEFLDHCRDVFADNQKELKNVDKLQKQYLEQLHSKQTNGHQFDTIFIVYRRQDRNVSLNFARRAISNPDLVGIVFVIMIDPSISSTPFAPIVDVGYYGGAEAEILFSMHTVFRIRDIKPMDENTHRLFQVDLTLTNDNDQDLRVLTDRIREESFPEVEGWYRLDQLLLKMGQSGKAQQVYEVIREQTTDESDKASIYGQIGVAKYNQGECKEAITFYEKTLPPNHPNLGGDHNNMGMVYENMGNYSKARLFYEHAVNIGKHSLPSNHPELQRWRNNLERVKKKL